MLLIIRLAYDVIIIVNEKYGWLMRGSFLWSHIGVSHDDDLIANADALGCCAIETDDARTLFSCDGIGLETVAVIDINNLHLLVFKNTRLAE